MTAILELESAGKSFGKNCVLADVSFSICQGKNLLLTGPSGGGKSTLLGLIAGLDSLDRGVIRIGGQVASHQDRIIIPPPQRGIAMVFQDLGLWANLSAFQNVLLGLAGLRLGRQEKKQRALAALEFCQIDSKATERPFRLSVGEQQRVALARAVAVRSKLLLLDEPFTGLDLSLKNSLLDPLLDLCRHHGTTVMIVSHNPLDAGPLSASIACLEGGRISQTGSPSISAPNGRQTCSTVQSN
jgi:ABC-type sugar transport system ATPase subunit